VRVALALVGLLAVPAAGAAGTARPPVSLIASPAHLMLAGAASGMVRVTNSGAEPVVVDAARGGFALDVRGRPRVVAPRVPWLVVEPRRVTLAPGATAPVTVRAHLPRRAEPGDHTALVLLTSRPSARAGLAVRMRLGVVVVVRVPGRIVRRLEVVRIRVRRRRLGLVVANMGNVTERIGGACPLVWLHRRGRIVARLRAPVRSILPHSRGLVELVYRGRARGRLRARIAPPSQPHCARLRSKEVAVRI
jgi:hypothetical protein